jgi:hypothetical protein
LQKPQNNTSTSIDNISVDNSRLYLTSISSIINGLSDNYTEILTIENVFTTINKFPRKYYNETITSFQTALKK